MHEYDRTIHAAARLNQLRAEAAEHRAARSLIRSSRSARRQRLVAARPFAGRRTVATEAAVCCA